MGESTERQILSHLKLQGDQLRIQGDQIKGLNEALTRLNFYLNDDIQTGRKGGESRLTIVEKRLDNVDDSLNDLKEARKYDRWVFTAGGGIGGASLIAFIKWIFNLTR